MDRKRTFGLVLPMALALSACGGGGGSGQSSPQPQPPAQPAASIVPVEGPARDLPADYASYNFNLLRVSGQVESAALVQGLRALNPGGLRIPGGTPGETWSWSRGGLRPPPYPGLPAGSGFSAEIEAISGLTPSVVDRLLDQVGTPALLSANMLTADLDENIADIRAFRAVGQPITRLELGNEEYFRTPNPRARFPTADQYAATAAAWSSQMKRDVGGLSIAAISPPPLRTVGVPFDDWMDALDRSGAWATIDAVAVHPYFDLAGQTPLASPQSAEAFVASMIRHDDTFLARVRQRLPAGRAIWITEWNVFETQSAPVTGGSWIGGLGAAARALNFLDHSAVDLSVFHVAIGERQWSALVTPDGLAADFTEGRPLVTSAPPFAQTAYGAALSLLGEAVRGGGTAQRLGLGQDEASKPLFGYRFRSLNGEVRSLFLNATPGSVAVRANGRARQLSAPYGAGVSSGAGVIRRDFLISGESLDLPAFSITLVTP
ncbi:MAG: hypothetical protein ING85_04690 [Phenylobacterium sp.]|uniref:hypothetical protein n=1 Tax=Phenylobacterium sp. TaxID=1871053 RepID=UPI0025D1EC5D|nr:hypothetical protein [Phenylobacterium sp.]MCA4915904.1 hypothetical protein [Phenylobacterium sp.]